MADITTLEQVKTSLQFKEDVPPRLLFEVLLWAQETIIEQSEKIRRVEAALRQ